MHFWARGYFVSTVGADEDTIMSYIQRQEFEDKHLEKLTIFSNG
jgi:putative transposase